MYLSEEKRAEIRACIEKQLSYHQAKKSKNSSPFYDYKEFRKVSQLLFDARDGKEVFTPF